MSITVNWATFTSSLQENFRLLRRDNKFIDIFIAVDDKRISAHSLLLVSCSRYFFHLIENLTTSCGNPTIVAILGVGHEEISRIIDMIYNGWVNVPKNDISKFVAAAKLLQINGFEAIDYVIVDDINQTPIIKNCYVKLKNMETDIQKIESASEIASAATPEVVRIAEPSTSNTHSPSPTALDGNVRRAASKSYQNDSSDSECYETSADEISALSKNSLSGVFFTNMTCRFCNIKYSRRDHLINHLSAKHVKDLK